MKKEDAYWIDKYGKVIPVEGKHITTIIENPKRFGITLDYIKSVYKKHKEGFGTEGKSRHEIMLELIKNGFIRVRNIRDSWTIQAIKLTNKVKNIIWDFVNQAIKDNIMVDFTRISIISGRGTITSSAEEIRNYSIFEIDDIKDGQLELIREIIRDEVRNQLREIIRLKDK